MIAHFVIEGAALTEIARALVVEGAWDRAVTFLKEGLDGLTYEHAISILDGTKRLTGTNTLGLEDDPDAAKYLETVHWQYAGLYRNGHHDFVWRPYAKVTSWGGADARWAMKASHLGSVPTDFMQEAMRDWKKYRSLFYAKHPDDALHLVTQPTPQGGREQFLVLFEKVNSCPLWLKTYNNVDQAIAEFYRIRGPRALPERGAAQDAYGDEASFPAAVKIAAHPATEAEVPLSEEPLVPQPVADAFVADMAARAGVKPEAVASLLGKVPEMEIRISESWREDNGWILPDGQFYVCNYHDHEAILTLIWEHLGEPDKANPEREAELAGWIKVRSGGFVDQKPSFDVTRPPTAEQKTTMGTWCRVHGRRLSEVIAAVPTPTEDEEE